MGKWGHIVSDFVKNYLPMLILRDPRFGTPEMPAMLKDVFVEMENVWKLQTSCPKSRHKNLAPQ